MSFPRCSPLAASSGEKEKEEESVRQPAKPSRAEGRKIVSDRARGNVYERDRESMRKVRVRTSERAGALRGERSQLVIRSPPTDERAATEPDYD